MEIVDSGVLGVDAAAIGLDGLTEEFSIVNCVFTEVGSAAGGAVQITDFRGVGVLTDNTIEDADGVAILLDNGGDAEASLRDRAQRDPRGGQFLLDDADGHACRLERRGAHGRDTGGQRTVEPRRCGDRLASRRQCGTTDPLVGQRRHERPRRYDGVSATAQQGAGLAVGPVQLVDGHLRHRAVDQRRRRGAAAGHDSE